MVEREGHKCFYCMQRENTDQTLDVTNEHALKRNAKQNRWCKHGPICLRSFDHPTHTVFLSYSRHHWINAKCKQIILYHYVTICSTKESTYIHNWETLGYIKQSWPFWWCCMVYMTTPAMLQTVTLWEAGWTIMYLCSRLEYHITVWHFECHCLQKITLMRSKIHFLSCAQPNSYRKHYSNLI